MFISYKESIELDILMSHVTAIKLCHASPLPWKYVVYNYVMYDQVP
jgi:hypothetical protein